MSSSPPVSALPTLFFLHALGSSRRAIDAVGERLQGSFRVVGIDLPGFGDAPSSLGTGVAAMVDHVVRAIATDGATRWLLVGHSMGGKIASIVAARTLSGRSRLFGLGGVVLIAGSCPSPEPMEEERRETMLSWIRDGGLDGTHIAEFIEANTGDPLEPSFHALASEDLRRMQGEAWRAWLERGSREDWAPDVGTLELPALILAGGEDGDLGEDGQRRFNLPHYPGAKLAVLDGAGHLLPLERPNHVADAIHRFCTKIETRKVNIKYITLKTTYT